LDRFDRKRALVISVIGLALGTLAGGFAWGLSSLVAARLIAGFFGGPATSLSYSIVADAVPVERRGRAMGIVMGAFSIASVLGVPAGLELARIGGWRMPFFLIGGTCLVITVFIQWLLPRFRAHLHAEVEPGALKNLWQPEVGAMLLLVGMAMIGAFMMIPNISSYLQFNLGYPRDRIGWLYLLGGALSFVAMRVAGGFVDRRGPTQVSVVSMVVMLVTILGGYAAFPPLLPIAAMFALFMIAMSVRGVCMASLASRVPAPQDRARYMSIQSAIQHISSSVGAVFATCLLTDRGDGALPLHHCRE
jgi:predicted MFS family arabinose efflux permease